LFRSFGELLQARLPQGSAPDSENHLAALLGDDAQGRDYVIEQNGQKAQELKAKLQAVREGRM
jgi:hypothetical protein